MNVDEIFDEVMNKETSAGRGKKQCPECNVHVGVRTYKCDCGHEFVKGKLTKKEKEALEDAATDEERLYAMCIGAPGGRIVYAGRGRPSYGLDTITEEKVFDYCNLVVHEGIQEGLIYTVEAIKHYLMHQLGYNSGEYMSASVLVDKWYDHKMGVDTPSTPDYTRGGDGDQR